MVAMTTAAATLDEITELVTTLLAVPPEQLTNCRGWTVHDLTAHLAAGAAETADLIESRRAGEPDRATRGFDAREAPYRALPDTELRDRLLEESVRLTMVREQLGDDAVLFTGRRMTAADFEMHGRSECALHRWDIVGRDDVGWELLARPALTRHALTVLTEMTTLPEAPANRVALAELDDGARAVLRSPGADDVVIEVRDGALRVSVGPPIEEPPALELDAAARLLILWGRREPSAPIRRYATDAATGALLTALVNRPIRR
jgi:uncharacterized protein (TIGR03083 family)